jgi:A/G-specific adenine glycosylase
MSVPVTPTQLRQLRRNLLNWFRKTARPLPWRESRDPYAIWISEVMLQQTQVKTVIAYFERFLTSYPSLAALSQANEQDVLKLWEGLGYYRRARDLLRSARRLSDNGHATIPDDPEAVGALPGFGRYTTNAVLSQAYDRRLPILEANSVRVLCRLFGIAANPKDTPVRNRLWELAEAILPRTSVGDFNQALMELGALVCTPTQPHCDECPIKRYCQAFATNRQETIPWRNKAVKTTTVEEVAVVVQKNDRLLLVQRPDNGRWAKMWEFPHHELELLESHEAGAQRLLRELGLKGKSAEEIATIRHTITRFSITMTCILVRHQNGQVNAAKYHATDWVRLDELASYPLSVPQRRLARRLLENPRA